MVYIDNGLNNKNQLRFVLFTYFNVYFDKSSHTYFLDFYVL